jgi:hypothetical protein
MTQAIFVIALNIKDFLSFLSFYYLYRQSNPAMGPHIDLQSL